MKLLKIVLLAAAVTLSACGDGGGTAEPVLVVASDAVLPAAPTTTAAVVSTPFVFPSGVAALGSTTPTTVTFTSTAASPTFAIASGTGTATGTTTFGSCIFAVTSSTFPAGHPLALGQTVTVNPCNFKVGTAGAIANGVAQSRSIALLLGAASSANAAVTVGVNPGGQLTLNGNTVGTVTLTPVSG